MKPQGNNATFCRIVFSVIQKYDPHLKKFISLLEYSRYDLVLNMGEEWFSVSFWPIEVRAMIDHKKIQHE